MDPTENFRNIVTSDDLTRARWEAVSYKVIADAQKLLGITLDREAVMMLPSARLATLIDEPLPESFLSEVKQLEAVQEQMLEQKLRKALETGEEEAHAELNRLPRHLRMSRARDLGMNATPIEAPSSVADEATMLRRLLTLSPAERLAKARAWGLA
ncbi:MULTISPECIES: hypothetical protein [unclassified Seohaeicola]|uniref:hypothetical protein n=1 Tax=unclassified Seohaeicola TaxID=2641111 RepID=UPI00237B9706|nr:MULTISPECIES: hypothetical protein [unclassified Seohaeicola]MDD9706954.1 hypothetical protein [Seohaeicola sp. 4SK31]